jgi:hypothetical protein
MRFAFSPKRLRRPTRRWHLEPLEPRLVLSACPGDQAQIAGSVWNDADRDGQWDQGEYAVFGIPLALTAADGTLIGTTTTGSSDAGDIGPGKDR